MYQSLPLGHRLHVRKINTDFTLPSLAVSFTPHSSGLMADKVVEVLVSPFVGALSETLISLIQKEVGLIWGVKEEMNKLSSTLSTIQDVLEDAEAKQLTEKTITNWLRKVKDAAYDADDVLDDWAMQLESQSRSNQVYHNSFTSCFQLQQIKFRWKIAKKINALRERFDEIAAERLKFHLREQAVGQRVEFSQIRETSSILAEPEVYGRDEDKESIVQLLLNNINCQEDVSTCTVLGIGGLGKTTLAQLVYNEDRVKEHFDVRSWVCVSNDFNLKRLTKAVVVSVTGYGCDLEELDPLQQLLQQKLAGKRFLLVLDDVWNENQEEWNKFKYSLGCGVKGSSIIVTTRLETVASIASSFPPYCLKFLSDDDCLSLFRQRAFGMGNPETPTLLQIGKEIVKKCGGVPLAAKALGGLLRFKGEENEWLSVRDSGIWDLPQSQENNILPALRLSYNHLPPYLRQCFSFCSIFPKDHLIRKDELIQLWMANGLLHSNERLRPEDVGNDIFNALLWRSFFQDVERDGDGDIRWCKMHDLVHDLACSIMINECCNAEVGSSSRIAKCTRHLSLIVNEASSSSNVDAILQSASSLRTVLFLYQDCSEWNLNFSLSAFLSLRALDMTGWQLDRIPVPVDRLKHLRYLNFSDTEITSLPESISKLINLQTLLLKDCQELKKLPRSMRNISSLRHLDIRGCDSLTQTPIGMGRLTLLQTLSRFIVGSNDGSHIKELHKLNQLRGELTIENLEHVKNSMDSKGANLLEKCYLRSLHLFWSPSETHKEIQKDVIEGLQPHPNMKRLSIRGYQGLTLPCWLEISSLPNLVEISLSNCNWCEHLSSLGTLPKLKKLILIEMKSVKFIDSEGAVEGFISLEELELEGMPQLEEWSNNGGREVNRLPVLKKLGIRDCPKLTRIPVPSSLERLSLGGCSETVLRSVKNLPMLSSLEIWNKNASFPEETLQNLTALQSLRIICPKLTILPVELESLTALTTLELVNCNDLVSLPKGLKNLSSLNSIEISFCYNLTYLPDLGSSLVKLRISDCSNLESLPYWLRYQTSLQNLSIIRCPKLQISKVRFQDLVSLRSLAISGRHDLTCLPEEIQHATTLQQLRIRYCLDFRIIPEWLPHLVSLRTLEIVRCHPDVERRCQKGNGEDWHKIAHIPRLVIQTLR